MADWLKEGEWLRPDGAGSSSYRFVCSECRQTSYFPVPSRCRTDESRACRYRFCPNCGKPMKAYDGEAMSNCFEQRMEFGTEIVHLVETGEWIPPELRLKYNKAALTCQFILLHEEALTHEERNEANENRT